MCSHICTTTINITLTTENRRNKHRFYINNTLFDFLAKTWLTSPKFSKLIIDCIPTIAWGPLWTHIFQVLYIYWLHNTQSDKKSFKVLYISLKKKLSIYILSFFFLATIITTPIFINNQRSHCCTTYWNSKFRVLAKNWSFK